MRLGPYLAEHRITEKTFAARIGVSQQYVSKIRQGKAIPSPSVMRRIIETTDRAVMPDDFYIEPITAAEPTPEPTPEAAA